VNSLETELEQVRELSVSELTDAIESIGFECTRCGACCKAAEGCGNDAEDSENETPTENSNQDHTATVFPDEVRKLQQSGDYDWRDVARPMPYGLSEGNNGPTGETFEWALRTDSCGDCTFYDEDAAGGECTVYGDRPLICRTYPFSVTVDGTTQPLGETVDQKGSVRAHECEGLGRDIDRDDARELAATLKERAIRELEEAIAVRDNYEPVERDGEELVVYDSEGPKQSDGTPW